jgi:hypothetical protein
MTKASTTGESPADRRARAQAAEEEVGRRRREAAEALADQIFPPSDSRTEYERAYAAWCVEWDHRQRIEQFARDFAAEKPRPLPMSRAGHARSLAELDRYLDRINTEAV